MITKKIILFCTALTLVVVSLSFILNDKELTDNSHESVIYDNNIITMPVHINAFYAKYAEGNTGSIQIDWEAVSSSDQFSYLIEKSYTGDDFQQMAKVKNTEKQSKFSVYDKELVEKPIYYRISIVDMSGKIFPASVFSLNPTMLQPECSVHINPSPCIGRCEVFLYNCSDKQVENAAIHVYDAMGNIVRANLPASIEKGSSAFAFDTDNNFKPAVFFVRGNKQTENQKIN